MSRLLLNSTICASDFAATTSRQQLKCKSTSSFVVRRRWKSLLHSHTQAKQRMFSPAAAFESSGCRSLLSPFLTSLNKHCALSTSASMSSSKCLALDNINPNFITMEYAVRGPLVIRAGEIEKELQEVKETLVFGCSVCSV
ncbi:uncharacterized protein LOC119671031 [Teleopsis dalmanni]|uniref:uncharacterized protein LOC119671031 n=1 Tax=Teleopsis dalmanni TaxID=139649 RepID=UPI0018CECFEC|nr:uncharacterized protein LOC119671031 [Teleopsis dalmanni]XP_037937447.1 uncharacterized protein LOC119671031 [Teleopsis dalmanni]